MGTQQQTASSNQSNLQFNPLAQQSYNSLIGSGTGVLQGYMNNPFGNPTYQLGAAASQKGASQAGQNNMGMLQQLFKTNGMGGTAGQGFMAGQNAQMGRANQSMMSQANLGNIQSALSRQMAATGMGMSFSPQMTGQSGTSNSTQSTSGLGTWLPQLLGSAAGMAMGGFGGGGGSSPTAAPSASPSGMPTSNPFAGFTNYNPGLNNPAAMNPFTAMMMQPQG
jgi:hypothetical protein